MLFTRSPAKLVVFVVALVAFVCAVFVSNAEAGKKNKDSEDILLYNGNIIIRGRGKNSRGNIVLANSQPPVSAMASDFDFFGR